MNTKIVRFWGLILVIFGLNVIGLVAPALALQDKTIANISDGDLLISRLGLWDLYFL